MSGSASVGFVGVLVVAIATAGAAIQPTGTQRVGTGFSRPIYATSPPGDFDRLFIAEQHTGRIRILDPDTGVINATPFLDIGSLATGNEQGLLGMAFDPDYADNGLFYVNLTVSDGTTHIRRYQVSANPDIANPASAQTVMTYSQPFSNHNGGWLGFGPNDGFLYISSGDGGNGNDPGDRGQEITNNLLGKMLRIDPSGDGFPADSGRNYSIPASNPFVGVTGDDEIWAYGLRNPWRASFDRANGNLYIGDVGQNAREEVDFQPAASTGGENYGWRLREGAIATPRNGVGGPAPPGAIEPIYDYTHGGGASQGFSITGGYVYRGPVADIQGHYFFADYVTDRIWSFHYDGSNQTQFTDRTAQFAPDVGSMQKISSFGEDGSGDLYIVSLSGEIFRIVGQPPTPGDTNGDQIVNILDYHNLIAQFGGSPGAQSADFNGDGIVDIHDFAIQRGDFDFGASSPAGVAFGAAVPEPASLILLSLGAMAIVVRRRQP
jgi:glucose/arabinose dehydrogenase